MTKRDIQITIKEANVNYDELSPELQERLKAAKTDEELISLAAAEGVDLSGDELKAIAGGFRPSHEPVPSSPYCYENCQEDTNTTCWGHSDS